MTYDNIREWVEDNYNPVTEEPVAFVSRTDWVSNKARREAFRVTSRIYKEFRDTQEEAAGMVERAEKAREVKVIKRESFINRLAGFVKRFIRL